jgi:tetratricopeptide (TPR) repeat protein
MSKKIGIIILLSLSFLVIFTNCTRHTVSARSQDISFPKVGRWKIDGEDSKRWTGNLVIKEVDGKEFTGYFEWYYSPGEEYVGREEFKGVYDAKSGKVVMAGYHVTAPDKLALGTYQAYLDKNGYDFVSGIWGGEGTPPDYGGWEAKFQTAELTPDVLEYLYKASSDFEEDNLDDAIKNAGEAIRLTRGVGEEAAKAFTIRAVAYVGKKDYDRAIEDFTSAIKTIPDAKMYLARGLMYVEKENYDPAIEDFNAAIRIELDAGMYLERAKAHLYKKEYDKAIEDVNAEIRLYSDESDEKWEAYVVRSIAHTEKGNNAQASEDFDAALRMEEEQAKLYNTRAWIYAHFFKREFDRAIEDASQAIKLQPNEAAYYDTRGWAYLGKGDYNSAADNFSKALQLEPDLFESKEGLKKVKEAQAAAE